MGKGIDFNDRYTIHLPHIHTTKHFDGGLMPVDSRSPRSRIELIERFGTYIKREDGYDFPLGVPEDSRWKAYFFLGGVFSSSTVQPVGVAVFEYVTECKELSPRWWLQWVWIHPYERRKGMLSNHWTSFRNELGDFFSHGPYSKAMEAFHRKRGVCVCCWKPATDIWCPECKRIVNHADKDR